MELVDFSAGIAVGGKGKGVQTGPQLHAFREALIPRTQQALKWEGGLEVTAQTRVATVNAAGEPLLFAEDVMTGETVRAVDRWRRMLGHTTEQLGDVEQRLVRTRDARDNAAMLDADIQNVKRLYDGEIKANDIALHGEINPITKELEGGMLNTLPYRVIDRLARAQREWGELTRIGRKNRRDLEPAQQLRAGAENMLIFYRRTIFRSFDRKIHDLNVDLGGTLNHDDLWAAIQLKMFDIYGDVSKRQIADMANLGDEARSLDISLAPLADDEIWILKKSLEESENGRKIIESIEVEEVATSISRSYTDFLMDMHRRGLMALDPNPARMYLPLQLEDAAQVAMKSRFEELGETMQKLQGRPTRAAVTQKFMLSRATNRMRLPEFRDGVMVLESGTEPKWVGIYTGQLKNGRHVEVTAHDVIMGTRQHNFDRSRQVIMEAVDRGDTDTIDQVLRALRKDVPNNVPDDVIRPRLLSGDKFDLHGAAMQGADANGPRWMPLQHASSPQHLNKNREAFLRMVGDSYHGPLFRTDPMLAFAGRMESHFISASTDTFLRTMQGQFRAMTEEEFRVLPKVLGDKSSRQIDGIAYRQLDQTKVKDSKVRFPLPEQQEGMLQLWPSDLASEVENVAQVLKEEENIAVIAKAADFVNTLHKVAVLSHPRWTIINVVGSFILAKMAGANLSEMATSMPRLKKVVDMAHGMGPISRKNFDHAKFLDETITVGGGEMRIRDLVEEAIMDRVINAGRMMQEFYPALAVGNKQSGFLIKMLTSARPFETKAAKGQFNPLGAAIGTWFKLNAHMEDWMRLAAYVNLRNQGIGRHEATMKISKFMFDYGDLSVVEKRWGTRIWPFYRWMRNNGALQMRMLFEQPRYAAAFPKLLNSLREAFEDENSLPQALRPRWIKDQMAIDVMNNRDNAIFVNLSSLTPAQELFEMGQALMGREGFQNFLQFYLSGTSPLLKNVVELATGREIFTGFEIGDKSAGAALSVPEYLFRQTGIIYEMSYKVPHAGGFKPGYFGREDGTEFAASDIGPMVGRAIIGGRVQSRDIEKLIRTKRFEEGDRTQRIRFAIKRAVEDGDAPEAQRLALEYVARMRVLWDVGMVDMVPKVLRARFRNEKRQMNRMARSSFEALNQL